MTGTTTAKKIKTIPCASCGQQINSAANFCNFCGHKNDSKNSVILPLEPIETKNSREKLLLLLDDLSKQPDLQAKELNAISELFESLNPSDRSHREIRARLNTLVKHPNKYIYTFALTKLSVALSPEEFSGWVKDFVKGNPPLNIPILLDAAPPLEQSTFDYLWDYVRNLDSLWLYVKYLQWAENNQLQLNAQVISALQGNSDTYLQKKLNVCRQLSYFPYSK